MGCGLQKIRLKLNQKLAIRDTPVSGTTLIAASD